MFEIWDFLQPASKFCLYLAMFVAAGGLIFEVLFGRRVPETTQRHVSRLVGIAAWSGLVLVVARVAVATGSLGGDIASAADPVLIGLVMKSPLGLSSVVAGIGFAMITVIGRIKARGETAARLVAAATVLLSLTMVGHATMLGAITGGLLALHLAGIAFWLGALLPLRHMCGVAGDVESAACLADVADRFGQLAQRVVAILVVAGLVYAAILMGSVMALLTSAYGQVLLTKILLVVGLLGLAARNRFRIVPALRAGDLSAALRLRLSIDLEVMLVLAILVASSLLTSSLTLPTMEMGQ